MATFLLRRSLAARSGIITRSAAVRITSRNTSTSALYGISALSDRHETQHFHKLSRLPLMEHSPTLKLIHTSEVAPGVASEASSSLVGQQSETQEVVQTKEGEKALGQADGKPAEGRGKIWDDEAVSAGRAILPNYRKEIKGLSKQLHKQKVKVAELERIAENRSEELQRVVKMRNGHTWTSHGFHPRTGRPLSKEEFDRRASDKMAGTVFSLIFIVTAFFAGRWTGGAEVALPSEVKSGGSNSQERGRPRSTVDRSTNTSDVMGSSLRSKQPANSWTSLLWKKQ